MFYSWHRSNYDLEITVAVSHTHNEKINRKKQHVNASIAHCITKISVKINWINNETTLTFRLRCSSYSRYASVGTEKTTIKANKIKPLIYVTCHHTEQILIRLILVSFRFLYFTGKRLNEQFLFIVRIVGVHTFLF